MATRSELRLVEVADELADLVIVLRMGVDPLGIVDVDVVGGVGLWVDDAQQRLRRRAVEADDEPFALGDRADEDRGSKSACATNGAISSSQNAATRLR